MTGLSAEMVAIALIALESLANKIGCSLEEPFFQLSF